MNIWGVFGWRRKPRPMTVAEMLKRPGVESATVENTAWSTALGEAPPLKREDLQRAAERPPVTPKRIGVWAPTTGRPVDTKCAWCNAVNTAPEPGGTMPTAYKCGDCGGANQLMPWGISVIVPTDSVTRQLMRGDVV